MSSRRAVFVDRDGVVNALAPDPQSGLPESPLRAAEAELLPGVAAALAGLREAGYLVICVTNQPGAAKEKTTVEELRAVQARIDAALAAEGAAFDRVEMCLHHPEGTDPELTGTCRCRKPAPGMLIEAGMALDVDFSRSWIIGDSESDIEAGHAAGCRAVLVEHGGSAHRRSSTSQAEHRCADLPAAARIILAE